MATTFGRCMQLLGSTAARISNLDRKIDWCALFPDALHTSQVDVRVRFEYEEDDDVRTEWVRRYVETYGGVSTFRRRWAKSPYSEIVIKHTMEDGMTVSLVVELLTKSESEGDEAEAQHT